MTLMTDVVGTENNEERERKKKPANFFSKKQAKTNYAQNKINYHPEFHFIDLLK